MGKKGKRGRIRGKERVGRDLGRERKTVWKKGRGEKEKRERGSRVRGDEEEREQNRMGEIKGKERKGCKEQTERK